jgi:hypothetical protein
MARDRIKRGVLGMILNCFLSLGKRLRPCSSRVDWCGAIDVRSESMKRMGCAEFALIVSLRMNDDGSVTVAFSDIPGGVALLTPERLVEYALENPDCFVKGVSNDSEKTS